MFGKRTLYFCGINFFLSPTSRPLIKFSLDLLGGRSLTHDSLIIISPCEAPEAQPNTITVCFI